MAKRRKSDNDQSTWLGNKVTGEFYQEIPYGSCIVTPAQQKRNKEYYKRQDEIEERKHRVEISKGDYGSFTWFFYKLWEPCDLNISPSSLTRIIYLSTYINYDNVLTYYGKPMTRNEMIELLGLSEREFIYFTNEMRDSGILEFVDDRIIISNKVFGKGRLPEVFTNGNEEDNLFAIRLYQKTVRNLYKRATPRSHKTLSYLFQMIPYINRQYNILCYNPLETDHEQIQPMLLNDYCKVIGYDPTNLNRLVNNILRPEFSLSDGTIETAVRVVLSVRDDKQRIYQVFVNPKVFYAGDVWEQVRILGKFG